MVRAGKPLVISEGELDSILLGQEIGDLVQVVTLGSASNRPAGGILDLMLIAPVWFLALDGDQAGDKNATQWPARARRIRPPAPYKDWTDAHVGDSKKLSDWADPRRAGRNLVRYIWAGILPHTLTPWEVLEVERWDTGNNFEPPENELAYELEYAS
jgi:hypothetical protein